MTQKNNGADFPHAPPGWSQAAAHSTATVEGLECKRESLGRRACACRNFTRATTIPISMHVNYMMRWRNTFHSRGGMKFLYKLLPGGPVTQGCRLAGLEPPAGSADKSFGSVM